MDIYNEQVVKRDKYDNATYSQGYSNGQPEFFGGLGGLGQKVERRNAGQRAERNGHGIHRQLVHSARSPSNRGPKQEECTRQKRYRQRHVTPFLPHGSQPWARIPSFSHEHLLISC